MLLAEQARKLRPSLSVLTTTAYAGSALTDQGRLGTDMELLTKPFTRAALAMRIRELLDRQQPAAQRGRILVVDDEELLRSFLIDMLGDNGCEAEEAATLAEGDTKFAALADSLSAAIIDVTLPDGSGTDLVRRIRQAGHQTPIVLTTGFGGDVREHFLDDALLRVLPKPFDQARLMSVLRELGVSCTASR